MKWVDIVTRKQNTLLIYTKLYGWCEEMKEVLGVGFNYMLMVSRQEATTYYVKKTELNKLLKILKIKLLSDKIGERSLAQTGFRRFQQVIDYLKFISQQNLQHHANKQLASYFKNYFKNQLKSLPFLLLPTFVDDIFVEEMSRYLEKILKISPGGKAKRIFDYLNVLTALEGESYATKAERELLEIALQLSKEKPAAIYKKVLCYTKKWEWLPIQAEEEPYDVNFFVSELQKLSVSPAKIKIRLSVLNRQAKTNKIKKAQLLKKIKIDQAHRRLINVFQQWVSLKDFRRAIISQERLYSRSLYAEIGKRLNLTGREVRFLSPDELTSALNQKSKLPSKKELHQRMKNMVLFRQKKRIELFTSKEANKIIQQELPVLKIKGQKILKGISVSPGKAVGKAKIVLGARDIHKIRRKDILVAMQTTPDLLSAMNKSAAIITDEGGFLCHAAIVSRELKLPCIVGTKIATKVLKDGDLVEVDADNGVVCRARRT